MVAEHQMWIEPVPKGVGGEKKESAFSISNIYMQLLKHIYCLCMAESADVS